MRVLVTGANGKTGRAVIAALAARGAAARSFIRDAAQWPALQVLGKAGDHAVGDLRDPGSIGRALTGCDAMVHIGPPMHPDEVVLTRNCIEAARKHGLRHFVYYSVMHTLRREVRHHRLKLECEEMLVESGLAYTIVQPIRYMQHLEPIWQQVTGQGVHAMPFNVDVRFNVADLLDHAAATAAVVTEAGAHLYATYELAGPEALSQTDMAAVISKVIGRPVTARAVPLEELRAKASAAGNSADRVEQMLAMNAHYDQHGFLGNPNILRMVLRREPTRFEDYVRRLWAGTAKPSP
jgi:uncharacterized protein YbjT (DUF2867 family)